METNSLTEPQLIGEGIKIFHNSVLVAFKCLVEEHGADYEMTLLEVIDLISDAGIGACSNLNHVASNGEIISLGSASQEERCFVKGIIMLCTLVLESIRNLAKEFGADYKVSVLQITPSITVSKDIIMRDNPLFR